MVRRKKTAFGKVFLCFILFALSTLTAVMFNLSVFGFRRSIPVYLFYIFFFALLEMNRAEKLLPLRYAASLAVGLILWQNVTYSNGAYTAQKVIFDRAVSLYTRVYDDMYEVEGYEHNKTPVIVRGDWGFNKYAPKIAEEYRDLASFNNTSITYRDIVRSFSRYLGEDIKLVSNNAVIRKFEKRPEVKEMPSFPTNGYCLLLDGYLIINFG